MPDASRLDRRTLLKFAVATAAAGATARGRGAQQRFGSNPFALGVASGSPTHDSVVLWTRLAGDVPSRQVAVRWEIAHDEAFTRIVRRGEQLAVADLAHSVHAEVAGLAPDRWYFYRFMAGDATSAVGRTRTFPAPDAPAARLRIAYASCQRWEHGYFGAYRHMAGENLDAVLFLGDYVYEYPLSASPVRIPSGWWPVSLEGYRERHAQYRGDPDLQAMHAACPWLVTWDDHEVQNDYAGLSPGDGGPPVADFAARRAAAYQAYYEHMPVRAAALSATRIHSQHRFGTLATIAMLDGRQSRDAHACSLPGRPGSARLDPATCAAWEDPRRTLLGTAQEQWLDGVFAQGGATWTVLGQQTLFGQRDLQPGAGRLLWNDGWDGYPAARRRLVESLQKHNVANPVLLGGDVHENWVGHVKADYRQAGSAAVGVEFCGTSITSRSGGNARLAPVLAENPHFVFADSDRKGYGVVEFTPSRLSTTLRVVDDVTRRDTRIETLAAFAVEAGRPRVEKA